LTKETKKRKMNEFFQKYFFILNNSAGGSMYSVQFKNEIKEAFSGNRELEILVESGSLSIGSYLKFYKDCVYFDEAHSEETPQQKEKIKSLYKKWLDEEYTKKMTIKKIVKEQHTV